MAKRITLVCFGKKLEIAPLDSYVDGGTSTKEFVGSAPGLGAYEVTEPVLSHNSITQGKSVSCKTTIKGKNIGQIAYELLLEVNGIKIGPMQQDFVRAPNNREIKGIVHPHWEGVNDIEFEFTPEVRLLYCGAGFTLACMKPKSYGVEADAQIWSLEGIYQRGGGEPFRVKLEFDNRGALVRKTGYSPASVGGVVAPFELLIEDGDTFEPFVTLIDKNGEISTGLVNPIMLGGGNQLHWKQNDVCLGEYHVSVLVEDFDGQKTRVSTPITITEA
jgi:hypothetical protein